MRWRRDQPDPGLSVPEACDLPADLVAGELAALPRLRALRDLDVELVRERAVLGRDTEAAGRDLLDARVAVAVGAARPVPGRVLAPLAAVALAADHVHRDRERLVRLGRERAVRHGAGREPCRDRLDRLDLLERNRLAARDELEQVSQLRRRARLHELAEPLVEVRPPTLDRPPQEVGGAHASPTRPRPPPPLRPPPPHTL